MSYPQLIHRLWITIGLSFTIVARCFVDGRLAAESELTLRAVPFYCARHNSLLKGWAGRMPVRVGQGYIIVEGIYGEPGEFIVNGEVRKIDGGWLK